MEGQPTASGMAKEELKRSSGMGFVMTLILIGGIIFGITAIGGGDVGTAENNVPATTTTTRSGTLSGNQLEVLSRNQFNLLSDVWNCYGDGSCIITSDTVSNTTSTVSTSNLDVEGDRNSIIMPDGTLGCENPDAPGQYSDFYCQGGQP